MHKDCSPTGQISQVPRLIRKIGAGEIAMPLVRIENSQKCAKGVHLTDLAKYLDARTEAARKKVIALTTSVTPPMAWAPM
jgi:hypothetical protein